MIKDIRLNLSMTDMKKWCDEYFATESSDIYCSKRKLVKRSSSNKFGNRFEINSEKNISKKLIKTNMIVIFNLGR